MSYFLKFRKPQDISHLDYSQVIFCYLLLLNSSLKWPNKTAHYDVCSIFLSSARYAVYGEKIERSRRGTNGLEKLQDSLHARSPVSESQ